MISLLRSRRRRNRPRPDLEPLEERALLSMAVGDFNGDGKADLAISAPGETVGGAANAGGVNVLYGPSHGLDSAGNQFWSEAILSVLGTPRANDRYGAALAVGDFNRDGKDDLAIGVPN